MHVFASDLPKRPQSHPEQSGDGLRLPVSDDLFLGEPGQPAAQVRSSHSCEAVHSRVESQLGKGVPGIDAAERVADQVALFDPFLIEMLPYQSTELFAAGLDALVEVVDNWDVGEPQPTHFAEVVAARMLVDGATEIEGEEEGVRSRHVISDLNHL